MLPTLNSEEAKKRSPGRHMILGEQRVLPLRKQETRDGQD